MGLYNFQPRFAPRIRAWAANPDAPDAKGHTIRAPRKGGREDKPGDTMHLYTGLRRKGAERIIPPVVCAKVESVVFWGSTHYPHTRADEQCEGLWCDVFIGPFLDDVLDDKAKQRDVIAHPLAYGLTRLDVNECDQLARRDGFASFADMMEFWGGRLPFYGHIFHWTDIRNANKIQAQAERLREVANDFKS